MKELINKYYDNLFSIQEIKDSLKLQVLMGVSLFVFFITFNSWSPLLTVTKKNAENGQHLCWPYFTSCGDWYFFDALPFSYSQNIFYMILFVIMVLVALAIWKKMWAWAHFGLVLLLAWEVLFLFVLNIAKRGNYDYYQVILTSILLFVPYKLKFLQITFCCLYFLASSIKIHEGWILGTYFTSMQLGMPLFPAELTPLMTNTVIFMEMVGTWFLLSSRPIIQRLALTFFIIFHLYSGLIVWYRYPATIMPYLLVLFGTVPKKISIPSGFKSLPGWLIIIGLAGLQSISFLIPKDSKMTFEGLNYGFYMFDSNHQCISQTVTYYQSGKFEVHSDEMESARSRCDPYYKLFKIWHRCKNSKDPVKSVKWQFVHSINGQPFYLIVDQENACQLEYHPLKHNEWIRTPEDGAKLIGYPVKNVYY